MVLSQAIQDWREYARHELGSGATTCINYTAWLRHFARWLAEQGLQDPPVQEISVHLVRRYSYALSGRNLRPRTVRGAMQALRALFAFLQEMGIVSSNPAREVRLPRKDAAIGLLVTDVDLVTLLEAAVSGTTGGYRLRKRCQRSSTSACVGASDSPPGVQE
jgi:integrase/recombinase XerC